MLRSDRRRRRRTHKARRVDVGSCLGVAFYRLTADDSAILRTIAPFGFPRRYWVTTGTEFQALPLTINPIVTLLTLNILLSRALVPRCPS